MVIKKFTIVIFIIFFLGLASADFGIGNKSHIIQTTYNIGGKISGWINISLRNESTDSLFRDSIGNSIKLISLLNSQNINYTCNSLDCSTSYSSGDGVATKNLTLRSGESKIIGIIFDKNITSINSGYFEIESDADSSCSNQLKVDILIDEVVDASNTKISEAFCSSAKQTGCFIEEGNLLEGALDTTPYCQRIPLDESPAFEIGAWVKKETGAPSETIKMSVYDSNGNLKKSCNLQNISTDGNEASCVINYSVIKLENYYVCIFSDGNSGKYKIRGQLISEGCGYKGNPGTGTENYAYQIFARGKKFDAVGVLSVANFTQTIDNYIKNKYGSLNCSGKCIAPIKIYSEENQNIILKSLSVNYGIGGGLNENTNLFYDLSEIPTKLNSGFQKISLNNASFILPSEKKNITYRLNLNGREIFSEKIFITKPSITIKGITPTTTANGYPTKFGVMVSSSKNISKYYWDFGDGKTEQTSVNYVSHTYNSTGNYNFKITVTDTGNSNSSGTFEVIVGSAESVISSVLNTSMENLNYINNQIKSFDVFSKNRLDSTLDLTASNEALNEIQRRYNLADSEDEYKTILDDLLKINIPKSVKVRTSTSSITFYPEEGNINLEVLKEIGGGDYDEQDENGYIEEIYGWNQENMETKISFKEFAAEYGNYEEPVLRIFDVSVEEKKSLSTEPYLVIRNIDNLQFKESYKEDEILEYTYITLEHPEQTISFSTTEDVDFTTLPLFISPKLDRLNVADVDAYEEFEDGIDGKWKLFALIFGLIIMIAFVIYIILQEWYKRKYEDQLFKNKNNLYNLVVFIENSRKSGKTDKQISNELKKSGWSSEQITYALKKHAGKRTGMIEIPITRIFGKSDKTETKSAS